MKIAVVGAKTLPPMQGGIEHYCAEMYPRIVAKGHSVDFFARSSCTPYPWYQKFDYQGVRVIPLLCPTIKGFDALLGSCLGAIAASGNRYDIVHFHALGPALFSGLSKVNSSAKIVVTCQGLDWQRAKWGKLSTRLIRLGEKTAVRWADKIVVVSKELEYYFSNTYGRETIYIPNGPAGYTQSDSNFTYGNSLGLQQERYLIFLGRLVPEKRPDLLLKAFQMLQPLGWKLVFVGGSSNTPAFSSYLMQEASKNPNILFAGELRGSRLAEVVRGAGLFVLPSDLEGLPLAMLESMLEGVPVVASDIPPHQQLIGEHRGVLFKAGDMNSCVQKIDWAIHHYEEMKTMAKKAQRYVQMNYNWEQITNQNLQLYESLCGSPGQMLPDRNKAFVTGRD